MTYTAPTTEQLFVLQHIARIDAMAQHDRCAAAPPARGEAGGGSGGPPSV